MKKVFTLFAILMFAVGTTFAADNKTEGSTGQAKIEGANKSEDDSALEEAVKLKAPDKARQGGAPEKGAVVPDPPPREKEVVGPDPPPREKEAVGPDPPLLRVE